MRLFWFDNNYSWMDRRKCEVAVRYLSFPRVKDPRFTIDLLSLHISKRLSCIKTKVFNFKGEQMTNDDLTDTINKYVKKMQDAVKELPASDGLETQREELGEINNQAILFISLI